MRFDLVGAARDPRFRAFRRLAGSRGGTFGPVWPDAVADPARVEASSLKESERTAASNSSRNG